MSTFDENLLDTNEYGILRIPARLWLGIIFSIRYILFFAICLFLTPLITYFNDISEYFPSWLIPLLEAPSIFLIIAAGFRTPNGKRIFRFIWNCGGKILAATSALNIAYTILFLFYSSFWQRWPELFLISCSLLDLVVLRTAIASPHIIQVFSEFPAKT
jgi:hypothetical protein